MISRLAILFKDLKPRLSQYLKPDTGLWLLKMLYALVVKMAVEHQTDLVSAILRYEQTRVYMDRSFWNFLFSIFHRKMF